MQTELNNTLATNGLWYSLDSQKLIRKNSAVAHLLRTFNCKNLNDLVEKSLPTVLDDKGYLAIKGY